ncbi:MAG: DivIVA domain-containing protein [Clostridiales bacterium]|nr:DivIVA domain-containing protein [Clostridiales bacterium]
MIEMDDTREVADVEALRTRTDADARFRRVFSGYDPNEVRAYVEQVKRVLAQQIIATKQEQESLIFELNSAKSEIQARNYAITSLKETLSQQEAQLNAANTQIGSLVQSVRTLKESLAEREAQLVAANTRITTLVQSAKAFQAERENIERIRAAAVKARAAAERVQVLEKEALQLRSALSQAGRSMESWRTERTRLMDENMHLRQELEYLRGMASPPAQDRDYGWNNPASYMPQRQAPPDLPQPENNKQTMLSQIVDKLANTFAEAYALVNQLRASEEPSHESAPQRSAQPRMQVLRPEGSYTDYIGGGRK